MTGRVRISWLLLSALFALPALHAAPRDKLVEESYSPGGTPWKQSRWQIPREVTIVAKNDTAIGKLYRFMPGRIRSFGPNDEENRRRRHDEGCGCGTCSNRYYMNSIQCQLPEQIAKRRYVAIDFLMRHHPVFEPSKHDRFEFYITRSNNAEPKKDYDAITGFIFFEGARPQYFKSSSWKYPFDLRTAACDYAPPFEPMAIRIVFDTQYDGALYIMVNHDRYYEPKRPMNHQYNTGAVRNIGICLVGNPDYLRKNFELSDPFIAGFDSDEMLDAILRSPRFIPYPYDALRIPKAPTDRKKLLRRLLNCEDADLQYAYARHFLTAKHPKVPFSPPDAILLLRKAAKQQHVLAAGLLGECLAFGFGVEQDEELARKFLQQAADAGDDNADALLGMLLFNRYREQFIFSPQIRRLMIDCFPKIPSNAHDLTVLTLYRKSLGGLPLEFSPRLVLLSLFQTDLPQEFELPPVISPFGTLSVNYPQKIARTWLTKQAEAGYAPADYAEVSRMLSEHLSSPEKIDDLRLNSLADRAVKRGFYLARLHQMVRNIQKGRSNAHYFTAQNDYLFADEPFYWMLKIPQELPDFPGIREFCLGETGKARAIWAQMDSPRADFCIALTSLMPRPEPFARFENMWEWRVESPDAAIAVMQQLERSADRGFAPAQYFFARFLLAQFPYSAGRVVCPWSQDVPRAEKLLKSALAKGHLKAAFILARQTGPLIPGQALAFLEPLCKANIPDALIFKAELLEKDRKNAEALAIYRQLAMLGEPLALSRLALRTEDPVQQERYWRDFMECLRKRRTNSPYDIYHPDKKLKTPYQEYDASLTGEQTPIRKPKVQFQKFRIIEGGDPPSLEYPINRPEP